jgi:hypothetical protein
MIIFPWNCRFDIKLKNGQEFFACRNFVELRFGFQFDYQGIIYIYPWIELYRVLRYDERKVEGINNYY